MITVCPSLGEVGSTRSLTALPSALLHCYVIATSVTCLPIAQYKMADERAAKWDGDEEGCPPAKKVYMMLNVDVII